MRNAENCQLSRRALLLSTAVAGLGMRGGAATAQSPMSGDALQRSMDLAASTGHELRLPDGVFVCRRPLLVSSGLRMRLAEGTVILKAFSNRGGTRGSLIRNRDLHRSITDVQITGPGTLRSASHDQRGNIMALLGDRITLSDWSIDCFAGGRALMMAGNHWRVSGLTVSGSPIESGAGGIRILGGRDHLVERCDVTSGDDAFQFVPSAAAVDPLFDRSISDSVFRDCTGVSTNARLMVAALVRPGTTAGEQPLRASITNCTFQRVHGGSSQVGALTVLNANSSGAIADLTVRDCEVTVRRSGPQSSLAGSVYLVGSSAGGVHGTVLSNLALRGQPQSALVVNGHVSDTHVRDCEFHRDPGGQHPVAVLGGRRTRISGTRFEGAGVPRTVVELRRLGGPVAPRDVTMDSGCVVSGVGADGSGLKIGASTGSRVVSSDVRGDSRTPSIRVTRGARDTVLRGNDTDGPVLRD